MIYRQPVLGSDGVVRLTQVLQPWQPPLRSPGSRIVPNDPECVQDFLWLFPEMVGQPIDPHTVAARTWQHTLLVYGLIAQRCFSEVLITDTWRSDCHTRLTNSVLPSMQKSFKTLGTHSTPTVEVIGGVDTFIDPFGPSNTNLLRSMLCAHRLEYRIAELFRDYHREDPPFMVRYSSADALARELTDALSGFHRSHMQAYLDIAWDAIALVRNRPFLADYERARKRDRDRAAVKKAASKTVNAAKSVHNARADRRNRKIDAKERASQQDHRSASADWMREQTRRGKWF